MLIELLQLAWFRVFGCRHKKCSPLISCRPGTPRSRVAALTGTYFICLNCSKEFAYDWDTMKVIDPEPGPGKILARMAAELYPGK